MALTYEEMVTVVEKVMEREGIQATIGEVCKDTGYLVFCTFAGGLLLGPLGLPLGYSISCITLNIGRGKCTSAVKVIEKISAQQRRELAMSVRHIFKQLNTSDVQEAYSFIKKNGSWKAQLVTAAASFLQQNIAVKVAH